MPKIYAVLGINDQDWKEIFSCLRFASMFSDKGSKRDDMKILNNIKIRDLDLDQDIKKYIKNRFWKGD